MTENKRAHTKSTAAKKSATPKRTAAKATASWLLPGEDVDFDDAEVEKKATDEELNRRYVKGEVRIVTESARYSLAGILAMLEEKVGSDSEKRLRYDLDPEYQRRHRWSKDRKSKLIESFLMNIPVPPIFLYERDYAQFEVMDGRQRLNALKEFYCNEFELEGLEHWKGLNGRTYEKLPDKIRDGIDRRYLSSIILLKETASDEQQAAQLKKLVFERLNSGGVKLSHQETRNAVYPGELNELCVQLSKNKDFKALWQIPEEPRTDVGGSEDSLSPGEKMFQSMDDIELVLRFFAYRLLSQRSLGLNNISSFLDQFLDRGNRFSAEVLLAYREMFETTVSLLSGLFGEDAFRNLGNRKGADRGPTKIVYDPLMWAASRYTKADERALLLERKGALRERLAAMYDEHSDVFAGRSTNANHVKERNRLTEQAFADVVKSDKA